MVVRTECTKGQIGLRSQDEHEEGVLERHVPPQEAEPDGDRHECDRNGCQELKDQGREEGEPERRHGRRAVAVGHGSDGAGLGLGSSEDLQRGEPRHDVEEVPGQALQGAHAHRRSIPRGAPDQRHEERDEGKAHCDERGADPIGPGHHADDGDRHDHGEEELREIAREIAIECVDAGGHQHAELPGVATFEAGGTERGDLVRGGAPQLGLGGGRRPMGGSLGQPGQERPADHGCGQKEDRSPHGGQGPVMDERIGHDGGDQPGLGDHKQSGRPADENGEHKEAPGGGGVVEQAGVEGATAPGARRSVPYRRLCRSVHSVHYVPSCCGRDLVADAPAFGHRRRQVLKLTGASR